MRLDNTIVHLSPLVNFYKGRDFALPLFFLCKSKGSHESHELAASQKLAACRLAECFHPEGTRECNDACFCEIREICVRPKID